MQQLRAFPPALLISEIELSRHNFLVNFEVLS